MQSRSGVDVRLRSWVEVGAFLTLLSAIGVRSVSMCPKPSGMFRFDFPDTALVVAEHWVFASERNQNSNSYVRHLLRARIPTNAFDLESSLTHSVGV